MKGRLCLPHLITPPAWHLIDADNQIVGRLAVRIAELIRGKHKPTYISHANCGDTVVVINTRKMVFTGKRMLLKTYKWHTGHPGGLKQRTAKEYFAMDRSDDVLRLAVYGMLPKNKLRMSYMNNLKLFKGPSHLYDFQLGGEKAREVLKPHGWRRCREPHRKGKKMRNPSVELVDLEALDAAEEIPRAIREGMEQGRPPPGD